MCGIAGIIFIGATESLPPSADNSKVAEAMLRRIQHRGREDAATFGSRTTWIGCCRLPIVDRDHGQQPVKNENGDVVVVYNGEIYNRADLRKTLVASGHLILTDCDSELIPHIYEDNKNNPAILHNILSGMFAIAIYDADQDRCVLMRDHIGKKPLYLFKSRDIIAFASERKAFCDDSGAGIFEKREEEFELLPGETVIIHGGKVQRVPSPRAPWKVQAAPLVTDKKIAMERVRTALERAVERRMPDDGLPVAVLCSGGIDSVIIAWLAKKIAAQHANSHQQVTAYVTGIGSAPDVRAAQAACDILQIPLKQVHFCIDDITSVIAEVVYHTESFEPNVVRNSLISYLLFKEIRRNDHRVALCGEGADELFLGYADFEDAKDKSKLMGQLLDDLHRTQLLRVDRTSMAFNIETRAPYLDSEIITLACTIASELNETRVYGLWQGKAILREAFRDVLPWETITRSKATFSYGAGLGDVSMNVHGPLEIYAHRVLGDQQRRLRQKYPNINLSTSERMLYLYYFDQFFEVPNDYTPPIVAQREIRSLA